MFLVVQSCGFFYTSAEVRIFSELVFNSGELRRNFGGVLFGIPERGTTMEDTIRVRLVECDGGGGERRV